MYDPDPALTTSAGAAAADAVAGGSGRRAFEEIKAHV
jgi:hypothetical protein